MFYVFFLYLLLLYIHYLLFVFTFSTFIILRRLTFDKEYNFILCFSFINTILQLYKIFHDTYFKE